MPYPMYADYAMYGQNRRRPRPPNPQHYQAQGQPGYTPMPDLSGRYRGIRAPTPQGFHDQPRYAPYGFQAGQAGYSQFPASQQPGYLNDPTLAPGAGGAGSASNSPQPPPGGVRPPIQFQGGAIPNWMRSQGWRSYRAPDGNWYWMPPGSPSPAGNSYSAYGSSGTAGQGAANLMENYGGKPNYTTF